MNGGYGDHLSVEELLQLKEPLLQIMASERAPSADFDDAVQEARITVWEVATARPGAPAAYLHAAARTRVTEFVTRGKPTGAASHRGRQMVTASDSLDDPDLTVLLEAVELVDAVVSGYVRGEVARALDALTPAQRRYVELRFWGGADRARLREEFGYDPSALWRTAKPRLVEALRHLVAV